MILRDVYQILEDDDRVSPGDEFALASIAERHVWGPCVSFVGHRVVEVSQRGRIIFRRPIAKDESST